LYIKLVIQKRYLNCIQNITINLAKGKRYENISKIRPEYENDLWFYFLTFIFIVFWIIDYIYFCRKLLFSQKN